MEEVNSGQGTNDIIKDQPQPSSSSNDEENVQPTSPSAQESIAQGQGQDISASQPMPANAIQGGREINKKVLYIGGIEHSVGENDLRTALLAILKEKGIDVAEDERIQAEVEEREAVEEAKAELERETAEKAKDDLEKEAQQAQTKNKDTTEIPVDDNDDNDDVDDDDKDDDDDDDDVDNDNSISSDLSIVNTSQTAPSTSNEDESKQHNDSNNDKDIEDNLIDVQSIAEPLVPKSVVSIKLLLDKNRLGFNYAFVEFGSEQKTEIALDALSDGTRLLRGFPLTANYAFQTQQAIKDTEKFNIFVGDLSSEVDDQLLGQAFSSFGSMVEARVMWDMTTGRSRGYGFVSFKKRADAEDALKMNGTWIGSRMIRCNWASGASRKTSLLSSSSSPQSSAQQSQQPQSSSHGPQLMHIHPHSHHHHHHQQQVIAPNISMYPVAGAIESMAGGSAGPISSSSATGASIGIASGNSSGVNNNRLNNMSPSPDAGIGMNVIPGGVTGDANSLYQRVVKQTPHWQTTVYVGNLQAFLSPTALLPIVQNFGYVVDFKHQSERGYAFVKYDTHERAALAIVSLNGFNLNGNILKCNWGKERQSMAGTGPPTNINPATMSGQFSPGIEYPGYFGYHRM